MTNQVICRITLVVSMLPSLALFSGCNDGQTARAAALPDVEVVTVEQKDVPIYRGWEGTLEGEAGGKPGSLRFAMYSIRPRPPMNVEYRT